MSAADAPDPLTLAHNGSKVGALPRYERTPMTKQTQTTVLAALALAAQQYGDPSVVYAAIRELWPDTDWSEWIAACDAARALRREEVAA